MKRISIVKNFKIWVMLSVLMLVAWVFSLVKYHRLSIEFTGGIDTTIAGQQNVSEEELEWILSKFEADVTIEFDGTDTEILIVPKKLGDNKPVEVWDIANNYLLQEKYIAWDKDIKSTSFIWPSIGEYMKKAAVTAIIWGVLLMGIYILVVFAGVREYFSPWIFSLVTVITLMHDVVIAAGWYGVMMMFDNMASIDSIFVMAVLTVLGYSINDTIVIFDRLRENIIKYNEKIKKWTKKLSEVFDESLYQTMRRSLGTSISTFVVVAAMWLIGTEVLKEFSFVIMVGIVAGTYSSIFIAAPMAYRINKWIQKKEKKQ